MEVTCRPLRPGDYPAVKKIIAEAFADHIGDNPEALSLYAEETWYDPSHLLVAELGGQVVGQMGVRDGRLGCGGAAFPAGLVGTVCTQEQYRGRGIGAQLVRRAFAWMEERGLALSYLHTGEARHGFYGRLGYRKALMEYPRLILDLPRLRLPPEDVSARVAAVADAPALDALYAACYGRAAGAWSRTPAFWARRLQGLPKLWSRPLRFLTAGQPRPRAYLGFEEVEGAVSVHELACLPGAQDLAGALLRRMLGQWQERDVRIVELALSSTHPLRRLADALGPEDRTSHSLVFIRIQDRTAFRRTAVPLLENRAGNAGRRLSVRFAEDGSRLEAGAGEPLHLELHSGDLAALLYNGRRLAGLRAAGGIAADPDEPDLLRELFPDTGACRCSLDAY